MRSGCALDCLSVKGGAGPEAVDVVEGPSTTLGGKFRGRGQAVRELAAIGDDSWMVRSTVAAELRQLGGRKCKDAARSFDLH